MQIHRCDHRITRIVRCPGIGDHVRTSLSLNSMRRGVCPLVGACLHSDVSQVSRPSSHQHTSSLVEWWILGASPRMTAMAYGLPVQCQPEAL